MKKIFTTVSVLTLFFASTLGSFAIDATSTWTVVTTTNTTGTQSAFGLKSINVVSLNWIELTFSEALEDSADVVREFKIVNKTDPLDTFTVVDTLINPKDSTKLLLALDKDTKIASEYEVTIVAIKSAAGKNIESWIDSTEVFVVADMKYPTIEEVINNYGNEPAVDLNAATEVQNTTNTGTNLAWEPAVEVNAVAEATKLPDTGPEVMVILILSIILWFTAFVFKTNKS